MFLIWIKGCCDYTIWKFLFFVAQIPWPSSRVGPIGCRRILIHHDHLIIVMIMAMAIAMVTIIHVYIIHILLVYYIVVIMIMIIRYYKHDENLSVVRHVVDPTLWITVLLYELRHDFFKWSNPKIHQTIPKWSTGLQTWSCSVVP